MRTTLLLCGCLSLGVLSTKAMTLDEYMSLVMKKNKLVSSYDISIEASKEKQIAGSLALSPVLTTGYNRTSDKSVLIMGSVPMPSVAEKRDTTVLNLGLTKKFSTGTSVSLTAETSKSEYEQPVILGNNGISKGFVAISLQQSLWKDFFGAGTRLRQNRESITNKLETFGFELKKRITLIETESDFWDYIVAQENLKLKQDNFARAKKLNSWTANRVYNGIGDQSDLLQVRALASLRELELATAQDEVTSRENKIKENIDLPLNENMPNLTENLTANLTSNFTEDIKDTRAYIPNLMQQKNIVKIESYLSFLEAEVKQQAAAEVGDSLKPDLALIGRYNTSVSNNDYAEVQKNITNTDRPITFVGLSLSWMFGSDAKNSHLAFAKKEALSSKYRAEQAKISGANAWQAHLRKYELNKKNILILEKIAKLQNDRAKAEQIKFSKGRTITSSVVNAETDSAEAAVNYLKAKSGLRKLEAATQLFMSGAE